MKYGVYVMAALATAAFLFCGHYSVDSYFNARRLKARAETLAVRTQLMKHQVGELEQKARILERVRHFVDSARKQRLTPETWSVYEVQIQDALAYRELAQIVEQCVHNRDLYFKPISFHVVVDQDPETPRANEGPMEAVPLAADASNKGPADVVLALRGAFWVRH